MTPRQAQLIREADAAVREAQRAKFAAALAFTALAALTVLAAACVIANALAPLWETTP